MPVTLYKSRLRTLTRFGQNAVFFAEAAAAFAQMVEKAADDFSRLFTFNEERMDEIA